MSILFIIYHHHQNQFIKVTSLSIINNPTLLRIGSKPTIIRSLYRQQQSTRRINNLQHRLHLQTSTTTTYCKNNNIIDNYKSYGWYRTVSTFTKNTMLQQQQQLYQSQHNDDNDHHGENGSSSTSNTIVETTLTTTIPTKKQMIVKTNRELAEERIQAYRAKRESRQQSIASSNTRNYQLKKLLYGNTTTDTDMNDLKSSINLVTSTDTTNTSSESNPSTTTPMIIPSLYQVKILVCETLRHELKLSGREKRGRVFIPITSDATTNMTSLRSEMHAFFRALRKDSYLLYGGYPLLSEDGTIIASISNTVKANNDTTANNNSTCSEWPITNDDDVRLTFQRANDWYESQLASSTSKFQLKRPSIVIHVKKNPNMLPRPPPPPYLTNMSDPSESTHISMLSFYAFPINGIDDPNAYAITLRKLWKPFQALGRVYVAQEGINAQMSVPTNVLYNFQDCCNTLPNGVGEYLCHNGGINIDPIPLTRAEFAVAGIQAAATVPFTPTTTVDDDNNNDDVTKPNKATPPFSNLHIRVRQQIVADGFEKSYDWQHAGTWCFLLSAMALLFGHFIAKNII